MENIPLIVIGGSDPSGGAGIQADLHTLFQLGLYASSVISSVTAQNEKKFISYQAVSSKTFSDQLRSLEKFLDRGIIKIGMMGNSQHLKTIFAWIEHSKSSYVILDPVLISSTGKSLIDKNGLRFIQNILPAIDLITPNIPEAEKLSGIKIQSKKEMLMAGEILLQKGARNILLKGGHLKAKPCDILFSPEMNYFFEDERIAKRNTHGTGCTLASAIAGYLSLGNSLVDSISKARLIVRKKIETN